MAFHRAVLGKKYKQAALLQSFWEFGVTVVVSALSTVIVFFLVGTKDNICRCNE